MIYAFSYKNYGMRLKYLFVSSVTVNKRSPYWELSKTLTFFQVKHYQRLNADAIEKQIKRGRIFQRITNTFSTLKNDPVCYLKSFQKQTSNDCRKQRSKTQMAGEKSGFKSYRPLVGPIETQGSCTSVATKYRTHTITASRPNNKISGI